MAAVFINGGLVGGGGGGGGGGTPDDNSVSTAKIVNLAVTTGKLADGSVTAAKLASAIIDAAAAVSSTRKLGTSSTAACAGDDARLSDTRTPTDASVTNAKLAASAVAVSGGLSGDGRSGTPVTVAAHALALSRLAVGTRGDLLLQGATDWGSLADVAVGSYLRSGGVGADPVWSTLVLPNAATRGDLLYASAADTISALADVAVGSYLRSGGVSTAPVWSTITLPNALTTGDLFSASATNVGAAIAAVAAGQILTSAGTGTLPAWSGTPTLLGSDASAATVVDVATLTHATSSTATAGIGAAVLFRAQNGAGTMRDSGRIAGILTTVTNAAEVSALAFSTRTAGGALAEVMRLGGDIGLVVGLAATALGAEGIGIRGNGASAIYCRNAANSAWLQSLIMRASDILVLGNSGHNNSTTFECFAGPYLWKIGANEKMRIDTAGSLELGGSAAAAITAILDLVSTTKGFLPPRMTTAQRDLISSPAEGLQIWNLTTHVPNFYDGTSWKAPAIV